MADNTLLEHFFPSRAEVDPEQQFGLNRGVRLRRLHTIITTLRKHKFLEGFTPEEFKAVLEDLGPSFVKIGQMLSTRSEILPKAYCDTLAELQMECEPMPFDSVLQALDHIYGARRKDIFKEIDPKPLGSASLAQVHKAVLHNGDLVAVKVQRLGVRTTMAQDIDVMRSIARHLTRFMKDNQMIDLRDVVEELWTVFLEETDFKKEAQNLEEFARNNKDVVFISCPKPYMEYCTEESLVMEYVEGISIRDTDELVAQGYNLEEIGEKILDNYATQVLEHGFFHADPHPGNIVIKGGQVVYLDLGNMGRLTGRDRAGFERIIGAVGARSASQLKDALISFSTQKDLTGVDHAQLLASLDSVLGGYGTSNISDIDIGAMLSDIMTVARQCKVVMPASVTSVSRGIVSLEGTLQEFVGNFNIVDIINSHIMRKKASSEEVEQSLKELLFDMRSSAQGLMTAAEYSGETLRMISRGQLKFNMEVLGSDEPLRKVGRIANRLALSLIIAGLLVSAALLSGVDMPKIFGIAAVAFFEYLIAFVMLIAVLVDIFRNPRL